MLRLQQFHVFSRNQSMSKHVGERAQRYAIAGAVLSLLAFVIVAILVGGLLLAGLYATGLMPMVKP
ncbi:MAG: hypothetical protein KGZ43_10705 [Sulfuritalea sp.]|nr:hypothetical protein [Sulfuritalea sp.]